MDPEALAYANALFVNFLYQMGNKMTVPVIVPYGRYMGASLETIALFATVKGVSTILSVLWMPKLSDTLQSRKLVLMVSLFGSSVGAFLQGASTFSPHAAVTVFMIGRGIEGFFSGSQPVIRAYVAEISSNNQQVLKKRLTGLQVITQIAGIVLQPIAGVLATFGLPLPFFVCCGVGVIGMLWTCMTFREGSEIHASGERSRGSRILQEGPSTDVHEGEEGKPLLDKVILLSFIGFVAIFIFDSAGQLLMPIILAQPSFGLLQDTDEATQEEIALAVGLTSVPFGICMIVFTLFVFAPVTKRCGDIPVLLFAGIGGTASTISYGFWVKTLWQVYVLQGFTGACFGLLAPSGSPLIARYASVHYPSKMATCQAVIVFGKQLGSTFGQNIMAAIKDQFGLRISFTIMGSCLLIFTIPLSIAFRLVEQREQQLNTGASARSSETELP